MPILSYFQYFRTKFDLTKTRTIISQDGGVCGAAYGGDDERGGADGESQPVAGGGGQGAGQEEEAVRVQAPEENQV